MSASSIVAMGRARQSRGGMRTIIEWVEAKDPRLADAVRDLCLEANLENVTFLFPPEETRVAIIEAAADDSTMDEALTLVRAHTLRKVFKTGGDLARGGVVSDLGIVVDVASGSGGQASLVGGAKLRAAKDFGGADAVWLVTEGEVPKDGAKAKSRAGTRQSRRSRRARSAAEHAGAAAAAARGSRESLAADLAREYALQMAKDRCADCDPYMRTVVSVLNFLQRLHPETFGAVLPLIDPEPLTSFIILFEPYKREGDYVLPDSVLFGAGGWNQAPTYYRAAEEYEAFFARAAESLSASPADVWAAIDEARVQIVGADGRQANRVRTPPAIAGAYKTFAESNKIGELGDVLPGPTVAAIGGAAKKQWQDDLRLMIQMRLSEIRDHPVFSSADFWELIGALETLRPGNDYARETTLSSDATFRGKAIAPAAEFLALTRFVNSTCFLYTAGISSASAECADIPTTASAADPKDLSVYDHGASAARETARIKENEKPREIDAGTIATVQMYIDRTGSAPAGVALGEAESDD